jgi:hypothetical protein
MNGWWLAGRTAPRTLGLPLSDGIGLPYGGPTEDAIRGWSLPSGDIRGPRRSADRYAYGPQESQDVFRRPPVLRQLRVVGLGHHSRGYATHLSRLLQLPKGPCALQRSAVFSNYSVMLYRRSLSDTAPVIAVTISPGEPSGETSGELDRYRFLPSRCPHCGCSTTYQV